MSVGGGAPGDTVVTEFPCYYGMLQALEAQGLHALELPTHPRHGLDLDALESTHRHLRALRRQLELQVRRMGEAVGEHFPEGTRVTRPEGGTLLWVELPRQVDAMVLHERALAAGIGIAPGPIFSAQKRYGHFIRLSCGFPWSPRMEAALSTLGSLARALM